MTPEKVREEARRYIEMLEVKGFPHWNGERFVWAYLGAKKSACGDFKQKDNKEQS